MRGVKRRGVKALGLGMGVGVESWPHMTYCGPLFGNSRLEDRVCLFLVARHLHRAARPLLEPSDSLGGFRAAVDGHFRHLLRQHGRQQHHVHREVEVGPNLRVEGARDVLLGAQLTAVEGCYVVLCGRRSKQTERQS